MVRATNDARAERRQQDKQRVVITAALAAGSPDQFVRDRGVLMSQKLAVDDRIAALKAQLAGVRSDARARGEYLPTADYRRLEESLVQVQGESQTIQARLGELRREEKRRNIAAREAEGRTFERRFFQLAQEALSEEDFAALCAAAEDDGAAEAAE